MTSCATKTSTRAAEPLRKAVKVHVTGDYGHRQPLAYGPLRRLVADRITLVEEARGADLLIVAHPKDLAAHGGRLCAATGAGQRLVLLSEEPFWDTIWGEDPFTRDQVHMTPDGPLPYVWLNHLTSRIFDFDRIPYFLLTDPRFVYRYHNRLTRNAGLGAAHWRAVFGRPGPVTFMAEARQDPKFDRALAGRDVFGLSSWRSRVALACTGDVRRLGRGWQGDLRRQALDDWHLDKLRQLEGRTRILSGIENTHLDSYVTEKLFDAYAVGAVPLYVAGTGHRVRRMLPEGAWLNLYGLSPEAAAGAIADLRPDAAAYAEAQARLAARFTSEALTAERIRLREALLAELEGL